MINTWNKLFYQKLKKIISILQQFCLKSSVPLANKPNKCHSLLLPNLGDETHWTEQRFYQATLTTVNDATSTGGEMQLKADFSIKCHYVNYLRPSSSPRTWGTFWTPRWRVQDESFRKKKIFGLAVLEELWSGDLPAEEKRIKIRWRDNLMMLKSWLSFCTVNESSSWALVAGGSLLRPGRTEHWSVASSP